MNHSPLLAIIENKGLLGGIAEKAIKNMEQHQHTPDRFRYFAFRHVMKHLDKEVLNLKYDMTGKLYSGLFNRFYEGLSDENVKEMKALIKNIRNINSHYIHLLDSIKIGESEKVTEELYLHIQESFCVAVCQTYRNLDKAHQPKSEVEFLFDRFYSYPKKNYGEDVAALNLRRNRYKEWKATFTQWRLPEAVDYLFRIKVEGNQPLMLDSGILLPLSEGNYLSFHACLFILSLFLYKHEAHQLIARVKGFKRNDSREYCSKLELFEFFSKRFTSQDVDSEEQSLVCFHDLVTYLNRFPVVWNGEFDAVKAGENIPTHLTGLCQYLSERRAEAEDETPVSVGNIGQVVALEGRNRDRFLLFAVRYMAEQHFFGRHAKFKCYVNYDSHSEEEKSRKHLSEDKKNKFHQGRLVHFITYEDHLKNFPHWTTPFVVQEESIQVQFKVDDTVGEVTFHLQRQVMTCLLRILLFGGVAGEKGKEMLSGYYREQRNTRAGLLESLQRGEPNDLYRKLLPKKMVGCYLERESRPVNPYLLLLERTDKENVRYSELLRRATAEGRVEEFTRRNKGLRYKLEFVRKAWHYMSFRDIYLRNKERLATADRRDTPDKGHHRSLNFTREEFDDFSRFMYRMEYQECKDLLRRMLQAKGFLDDPSFAAVFEAASSLEQLYKESYRIYRQWLTGQEPPVSQLSVDQLVANYQSILEKPVLYINLCHFRAYIEKEKKHASHPELDAHRGRLISAFYDLPAVKASIPIGGTRPDWKRLDSSVRLLHGKLFEAECEDALLYELAWRYRNYTQLDGSDGDERARVDTLYDQAIFYPVKDGTGKVLYYLQTSLSKIERLYEELNAKRQQESNNRDSFLAKVPGYLEQICRERKSSRWPRLMSKDPKYNDIVNLAKDRWENTSDRRNGVPILEHEDLYILRNHVLKYANKVAELIMQIEKKGLSTMAGSEIALKLSEYSYLKLENIVEEARSKKLANLRRMAFHFGLPLDKSYILWYYELKKEV